MTAKTDFRRGIVLAAAIAAATSLAACNRPADQTGAAGAPMGSTATGAPTAAGGASTSATNPAVADPSAPTRTDAAGTTDANRSAANATGGAQTARTNEAGREMLNDSKITAQVKTALLAEPATKGMNINVETSNGVVSLSGRVSGESERSKALQVARAVTGVRDVADAMSTTN